MSPAFKTVTVPSWSWRNAANGFRNGNFSGPMAVTPGKLIAWTEQTCHWKLKIVKRSDKAVGFTVLPRRWVVERTISWVNNGRRLSKDYEYWPETSEALIHVGMIDVMLKRLTGRPLTEAARRQLAA